MKMLFQKKHKLGISMKEISEHNKQDTQKSPYLLLFGPPPLSSSLTVYFLKAKQKLNS